MKNNIFARDILQGRVAFVTGGGTGMTGGIARSFAAHGAKIAIPSRKEENPEWGRKIIGAAGGECLTAAADVREFEANQTAVAKTVEDFGKIQIVVNGAAGNFLCAADQLSSNGFGTVLD